ncbi:MAG: GTP-binding protein HflX [Candidatus Magnetoglobus multicellularis str. Araruama]|uniref:GTPase HflX n=1 Tax=Candidatus Magnetoglobus multicellularis str. Araruama TaxID=890399 RepID=A0A1V1PFA9_9BACT|nr:MAG: GTP-binding protein HflX [Candidatus Magnetoglobus multicellularis str. Araruama]
MKRIHGNTTGLKPNHLHRLEKLYHRRSPQDFLISQEIARDFCRLSHEIHRQTGLLVDRKGVIRFVIVGDHHGVLIPRLDDYRFGPGRLNGLRFIHTHLDNTGLSEEDIADLILLRMDLVAAITLQPDGTPRHVYCAHLLPKSIDNKNYTCLAPMTPGQFQMDCRKRILDLEAEMSQQEIVQTANNGEERAFLVHVTHPSKKLAAMASMDELSELAQSCGVTIIDRVIQYRQKQDARFLLGKGKIRSLTLQALQQNANLMIFDQELNPSQIRSITDAVDLRVIDRTQLILDIFARQAKSRAGKLQVEMAQLKYILPRLVTQNSALSRLAGGIGGRGPGETRLEINRRRVRERIKHLDNQLKKVQHHRIRQKSKREKRGLPVISIIGYTNAGKSTLLNTMTQSQVRTEDRLFVTLDPTSRRIKFPQNMDVILTDTVGFIRDLPDTLVSAFQATLEQLDDADILLHVVDASNPDYESHIKSVDQILETLNIQQKTSITVFNKMDRLSDDARRNFQLKQNCVCISARNKQSLNPLIDLLVNRISGLWNLQK